MPLYVLFLVLFLSIINSRDYQKLLSLFVISGICTLPIVSLTSFVEKSFLPQYDLISVYLRVLLIDHGFPLVLALIVYVLIWWVATIRLRWKWNVSCRLVTVGGFYSAFEALNQFLHYSDPSWYQLIVLPLLRLSTVSAVVSLLVLLGRQNFWKRIGSVLVLSIALVLAAAISSAAVLQRFMPPITGGAAIILTAITTFLLLVKMNTTDTGYHTK